jgi:Protein of unknown function (DUF4240)
MDETRFWKIIDRVRRSDDDPYEAMQAALSRLSADDIAAFAALYNARIDEAEHTDLWGAAYLINGGCSDDGFHYFRAWLVSQGRTVYEAALANPDSLAAVVDGEEEVESDIDSAIARAWEEKTGRTTEEFYEAWGRLRVAPAQREHGEDWEFENDEEMRRRFPRLAAIYLGGTAPDGK